MVLNIILCTMGLLMIALVGLAVVAIVLEPGFLFLVGFFGAILVIIAEAVFYAKTNKYPLNALEEYMEFDIFRARTLAEDGTYHVYFRKEGAFWVCQYDKKTIKLDLKWYLFPKLYVVAFCVRALRYRYICGKHPLYKFFKFRLYVPRCKDANWYVHVIHKKEKVFQIAKRGYTKYSVLTREITKAPFVDYFMDTRPNNSLDIVTGITLVGYHTMHRPQGYYTTHRPRKK